MGRGGGGGVVKSGDTEIHLLLSIIQLIFSN